MPNTNPILQISNLYKTVDRGRKPILQGVSLTLHQGEIVSIIGPSGSGKTTVLRCVSGLDTYDSGWINIQPDLRVGMIFQHFNLFPHMTLIENLTYAPIKVLGQSKEQAIINATSWIRKLNLLDKKDHCPSRLSGGQKQRAAIARALCMQQEILLIDEPTSALDPENAKEALNLIKEVAQSANVSMLIVTHEIKFATNLADRILFMDQGSIIEDLAAADLFQSTEPRLKNFLNHIL